jgi:hypoxanthine phosphoribosyltransferase
MSEIVKILDLSFKKYIKSDAIQSKVLELANAIKKDYEGKKPLFIGVLNGAFIFAADLIRATEPLESEITFTKLSSYAGTTSSGSITELIGLEKDVEHRHVIIVEDIIDTGYTLYTFIELLKKSNPASIAIASCLVKPEAMAFPLEVKYKCFDIPKAFVVGYGLDYDGLGRQFKSIYQLNS